MSPHLTKVKSPKDKTIDNLTLYLYQILTKNIAAEEFIFESKDFIRYYRTLLRAQRIIEETNANPYFAENSPIPEEWQKLANQTIYSYGIELLLNSSKKKFNFDFKINRQEIVSLHAMCYTATRRKPEQTDIEKLKKSYKRINTKIISDTTWNNSEDKDLTDLIDDPYLEEIEQNNKDYSESNF